MKYNVGDKVRILHTDYIKWGLDVGSVHEVVSLDQNGITLVSSSKHALVEGLYFYYHEVEPAIITDQIEVGKTYTAKNGHEYTCIAVTDTQAWLHLLGTKGTAYVWNIDGKATLGDDWDIDFGPKVETVTVKGSIQKSLSEYWITFHSDIGKHKFNLEVTTIEGVPDWSTAKVTPCYLSDKQ